jgi:NitT/TauT family transport system permease protein
MSTSTIEAPRAPIVAVSLPAGAAARLLIAGLTATVAWFAFAAVISLWPDKPDSDWPYSGQLAAISGAFAVAIGILTIAGFWLRPLQRVSHCAPWLTLIAAFLGAWEIVTAKLGLLPMPFFPPPQALLEVLIDDWARLGESILASFRLLAGGYVIGALAGFAVGVSVGWSRAIGYWIHPILRFVGPLPATAWLPLAFFVFPSSWSASTFLIALATGFPVTVLT